jgi:hypothetical protein
MADTKISELTSITGANVDDTADELAIVDDSATQTKKITRAELFSGVDKIHLSNKEKSDLSADGDLGFDSSQGLILYRTQQGVSDDAVTVLDGANVAAGTGVSITNLGAGGTGTQTFTFSIGQAVGTGDSPTFAGLSTTGDMTFGDNDKAIFGAGSDLQIYHDGGTSFIEDAGTGNLQIKTDGAEIDLLGGSEYMLRAFKDGAVSIFYDNSIKMYTTSAGIQVSGKTKIGGGADGAANADELVASKDQTNVGISILSEDATGFSRLLFGTQTDTSAAKVQYTASSDEIILQSDGIVTLQSGGTNDRVTVDSSGNVGIGTTSPSENLHVVGSGGTTLRLEDTGTATASGIDFYGKDVGGTTYKAGNINSAGGTGSLEFSADPTNAETSTRVTFLTDGTERVRIDDTGLGIGTTSPAQALDVTGSAAVSDKAKIGGGADGAGNADELVLSKNQNNVGMSLLAADATGIVRIYLGSQTDTTAASIRHSESNERLFLQAKGDLYFQTGGTSNTMTLNTSGDLDVTGALSKGSGSFKIDHPLKPETHHLVHSFLEGPQADNIYRGTVALVSGAATVNLDTAGRMTEGTFVALNGNVQCFTSNEQGWTAVKGSVSGNILTIEAQDATCTDTVSWMVVGERHDQHMIDTAWTDAQGRVITEPEKVEDTQEEAA